MPGLCNGLPLHLAISPRPPKGLWGRERVISRPVYGRQKGSQPPQTLLDIIRYWVCRLVREPTATTDVVTVTPLPGALPAAAASNQLAANSTSHRRLHTRLYGRRVGVWAPQCSHGTI